MNFKIRIIPTAALLIAGMAAWTGPGAERTSFAQDGDFTGDVVTPDGSPTTVKSEDEEKVDVLKAPEQEPVRKIFTKREIERYCGKYAGQLIAYYGDVWQVQSCTRRVIHDSKTLARMIAKGAKVQDVDGDVIAAIPEGVPLDADLARQSARTCKELNNKYVSYSSVDVYYIEKCRRRLLPDWATYIKHREQRGDERGEIFSLSWEEFAGLEEGQPIPSVVDDMFARLLSGDGGVDIIPIDEACAGVNGKVVTYYDKMYQIEKCRKREVMDPGKILQQYAFQRTKFPELTSQQWLSLPDGAPVGKKKEQPEKPQ